MILESQLILEEPSQRHHISCQRSRDLTTCKKNQHTLSSLLTTQFPESRVATSRYMYLHVEDMGSFHTLGWMSSHGCKLTVLLHLHISRRFSTASRTSLGTSYSLNWRSYALKRPSLPVRGMRVNVNYQRRHWDPKTSQGRSLTTQPDEEIHDHLLHDPHILLHGASLLRFFPDPLQSRDAHVRVNLCGESPAFLTAVLVVRE